MRFNLLIPFVVTTILMAFSGHLIQSQNPTGFWPGLQEEQLNLEERIRELTQSENYKKHLHAITSQPHYAGSQESREVIDYLAESMREAGLEIELSDYDVLLSNPGEVHIQIELEQPLILNKRENIYEEDEWSGHPSLTHGWNAYSGSGEVTAEVVYVNYGRKMDFAKLDSLGVDLTGKIALARYGGNFRGYKAKYAEESGAAGLIIFTDHPHTSGESMEVYPHKPINDESAIQRGSLLTLKYYGDPLTPFEPSLPLDHPETPDRLNVEEVDLPAIPVAPIGYGAAREILVRMNAEEAPESWQGGFDFPYLLQGGEDLRVTLKVEQPLEIKRITNVIGKIEGSRYPDEWIILGCHHDAWTFGTSDPNSGTALILTLTDALGELMAEGWRPQRTLIFAHWDAEEYGLIGSSEWVEHHLEELKEKAVLYLNADMSVTGPNFRAAASPLLHRAIVETASAVIHPDTNISLLEYWTKGVDSIPPSIGKLGSGSDFAPFVLHAGIPSAQISSSGRVPVYHSAYDNLYFYENFLDGEYKYGPALASFYGILATRFANAQILPYDIQALSDELVLNFKEVNELTENDLYKESRLSQILNWIKSQSASYEAFIEDFGSGEKFNFSTIPSLNKSLMELDRLFLLEEGLEFNAWLRNIYISPDPFQGYAAWTLPAIRYAIATGEIEDDAHRKRIIELHQHVIREVAESIREINRLVKQ
nr:M28 family metallopeptidase [Saprospiraceae bacterium]